MLKVNLLSDQFRQAFIVVLTLVIESFIDNKTTERRYLPQPTHDIPRRISNYEPLGQPIRSPGGSNPSRPDPSMGNDKRSFAYRQVRVNSGRDAGFRIDGDSLIKWVLS